LPERINPSDVAHRFETSQEDGGWPEIRTVYSGFAKMNNQRDPNIALMGLRQSTWHAFRRDRGEEKNEPVTTVAAALSGMLLMLSSPREVVGALGRACPPARRRHGHAFAVLRLMLGGEPVSTPTADEVVT
jgi:hypothetical protein